jgi:hypothetical protein
MGTPVLLRRGPCTRRLRITRIRRKVISQPRLVVK